MSVPARPAPRTFDIASMPFTEDDWIKIADRFWPKVDQRGEDDCWPYTGHLVNGYGRFFVGYMDGKKIVTGSNRVAFFLVNGFLDPLLDVLHSCDTPPCANWKHLSQGTHAENMAQRDARGRHNAARGEQTGTHVLLEKDVILIHQLYAQANRQWSQRALGARFKVSQVSIHNVLIGKTWPHLKPTVKVV